MTIYDITKKNPSTTTKERILYTHISRRAPPFFFPPVFFFSLVGILNIVFGCYCSYTFITTRSRAPKSTDPTMLTHTETKPRLYYHHYYHHLIIIIIIIIIIIYFVIYLEISNILNHLLFLSKLSKRASIFDFNLTFVCPIYWNNFFISDVVFFFYLKVRC
ncbi:hypothetical protein M434DRAFT_296373 [Hypoxylon sp. CO27-5]|nr:hypothetical protein M434DRAFT_296373 [Hypoxylon sp. CO27-5]